MTTYESRPPAEEDKSVLYGTVGFIGIGAIVIFMGYLFGWI